MSKELQFFILLSGVAALLSIIGTLVLRRWWLASPLAAGIVGLAVMLSALARNDWYARPDDVAFWLPAMAAISAIYALPAACIGGLLLHWIRKRKAKAHLPPLI